MYKNKCYNHIIFVIRCKDNKLYLNKEDFAYFICCNVPLFV